jgi:hypothetical protein
MTLSFDNHTFGADRGNLLLFCPYPMLDVMELDGVEHDPVPFQNAEVYAGEYHTRDSVVSAVLMANL